MAPGEPYRFSSPERVQRPCGRRAQSVQEPRKACVEGAESESEGLGEVKGCGGWPRRGSKGLGGRHVFSRDEH